MTPFQVRGLQQEMEQLGDRLRDGHMEPDDLLLIVRTLAEVLAHLASAMQLEIERAK